MIDTNLNQEDISKIIGGLVLDNEILKKRLRALEIELERIKMELSKRSDSSGAKKGETETN